MLVFVSDLHIGDHTTGVQHLDFRAFAEALPNIGRQATENGSAEVIFVFLGDIFDLVRTREWTNLSKGRPWDTMPNMDPTKASAGPNELTQQNAIQLLKNIISHEDNAAIFNLWSHELCGRLYFRDKDGHSALRPRGYQPESNPAEEKLRPSKRLWPCDLEPRRVFIPGNHDRMINQLPGLRQLVIECLGLNIGCTPEELVSEENPFQHTYLSDDYRVLARHGQEWDSTNFEYADQWTPKKLTMEDWRFQEISIGEIVAAEVASRLPDSLAEAMRNQEIWSEADRERAVEKIKILDDVRPMTAILPWLLNTIDVHTDTPEQKKNLEKALTETIHEVACHVESLDFVHAWARRHRKRWQKWAIIFLAKRLKATTLNKGMEFLESDTCKFLQFMGKLNPCAEPGLPNDNYATAALLDVRRAHASGQTQVLYVLYGHNHLADQVPLDEAPGAREKDPDPNSLIERVTGCSVYLNTGTWRPLVRQAISRTGFMHWKNLTYTIFYCYDQDPGSKAGKRPPGDGYPGIPTFEVWTGALLSPHRPNADLRERELRVREEAEAARVRGENANLSEALSMSSRENPNIPLENGKILPWKPKN